MPAIAAITIFLGAFLLFLVQPVLGKMILPWFGGTPAVWTTCMLFFQVVLLAGYAYAALLVRWGKPTRQAAVHLLLLVITVGLLPITPTMDWKPPDGENPTWRILAMLTACVGAPYFLLSATSPLVQSWFAAACPGRSPYRLYALSNIASLGALLIYPFVVEPALSTSNQGWIWSGTFIGFVAINAALTWQVRRSLNSSANSNTTVRPPLLNPAVATSTAKRSPVNWQQRLTWLALPTLASSMLLAVTNHLCQDVAVVPFLWIVPLSLYLLSLIICFDRDSWYWPLTYSLGAMLAILIACDQAFMVYLSQTGAGGQSRLAILLRYDIRVITGIYLSLFFLVCMVCHGEVVRRRPSADRLTEFYLTIAAGGALGGLIVAVLFPSLTSTFLELKIGLVLSFLVATAVLLRELGIWPWIAETTAPIRSSKRQTPPTATKPVTKRQPMSTPRRRWIAALAVLLTLVVGGAQWLSLDASGAILHARNFYGTLTVREWFTDDPKHHGRALYHGSILHGYQFLSKDKEFEPTTYYSEQSGVGLALQTIRGDAPLKVGVVGLGIGTLAAYGKAGDTFRFYEINPLVIQLAYQPFTFLSGSAASIEVVSGDARLSLEREAPQNFDVLVLDAFSGDSIPVHLLTREAMEVYRRHLKPTGLIAVHFSNRYIDLMPVVCQFGSAGQMHQAIMLQNESQLLELSASEWTLLAPEASTLQHPQVQSRALKPKEFLNFPVWTDDYNNLFQVLRQPP